MLLPHAPIASAVPSAFSDTEVTSPTMSSTQRSHFLSTESHVNTRTYAGGVIMGGLEEEAEEEEEAAAAGSGEGLGLMSPTEEDTFHGDDVEPVSTNMTV